MSSLPKLTRARQSIPFEDQDGKEIHLFFEHPSSSMIGAALSLGGKGLPPKGERDDGHDVLAVGRSAEEVSCMCIKAIEGQAIAFEKNDFGFDTIPPAVRLYIGNTCLERLGIWLLDERKVNEDEKKD